MMPQLTLNGEAIFLKNISMTPSMTFKESDQSGQSSSTNSAEQGIKAKELKVTGLINFIDEAQLTRLFALAESLDGVGQLTRYRVGCDVARAINLREATFSGSIDAAPADGKMAWQVSFTLKEKTSVPEKKATRSANVGTGSTSTTQTADGPKTAEDLGESEEELSWFERKVLKPIDESLGKNNDEAG